MLNPDHGYCYPVKPTLHPSISFSEILPDPNSSLWITWKISVIVKGLSEVATFPLYDGELCDVMIVPGALQIRGSVSYIGLR